jgi:hypothetical protein
MSFLASMPAAPAALMAALLTVATGLALGPPVAAALPSTVAAQDGGAEQGAAEALTPPANDAELGSFVNAFVRLIGVQHGYLMLMQGEDDSSRLEQLRASAMQDMTAAVQKDGMSIDRYNQIAGALRTDTELQGRVEAMLEQLAQSADGER